MVGGGGGEVYGDKIGKIGTGSGWSQFLPQEPITINCNIDTAFGIARVFGSVEILFVLFQS